MLLKNIDKGLTENEVKIVFDVFDSDKDNEVNFQEFESAIFPNNSQNSLLNKKEDSQSNHITQHTNAFLQKITKNIINNELDLNMIFTHFDTDGNKSLDLKEFSQFIKVVYMKAEAQDIKEAFKALDVSSDGFIQLEEFLKLLK